MQLLILCAPVWLSSRALRWLLPPPQCSVRRSAKYRGSADRRSRAGMGQFLSRNARSVRAFLVLAGGGRVIGIRVSATYWPPKRPNQAPLASGPLRYGSGGGLQEMTYGQT